MKNIYYNSIAYKVYTSAHCFDNKLDLDLSSLASSDKAHVGVHGVTSSKETPRILSKLYAQCIYSKQIIMEYSGTFNSKSSQIYNKKKLKRYGFHHMNNGWFCLNNR